MDEKIVKLYKDSEEVLPVTITQAVIHQDMLLSDIIDNLIWKNE